MPENNPDTELYWLAGIAVVFVLSLLVVGLAIFTEFFFVT